jgi:hypothetical protein
MSLFRVALKLSKYITYYSRQLILLSTYLVHTIYVIVPNTLFQGQLCIGLHGYEIWDTGLLLETPEWNFIFKEGCPGWGANPGSFDFIYFLIPSLYRWAKATPPGMKLFTYTSFMIWVWTSNLGANTLSEIWPRLFSGKVAFAGFFKKSYAMYICMYVCTYVCMYVCMYVCTCFQIFGWRFVLNLRSQKKSARFSFEKNEQVSAFVHRR